MQIRKHVPMYMFLLLTWNASLVQGSIRNIQLCRVAETECVTINSCTGLNERGQSVLRDTWYHRSVPALWFEGYDTRMNNGEVPTTAYSYYSIASMYWPVGVRVKLCEPNFAKKRSDGSYECYEDSINEADCDVSSSNSDGLCSVTVSNSRAQMFQYSYMFKYGCHDPSDLSPGKALSSLTQPNIIEDCSAIGVHATYNECGEGASACCDFSCADFFDGEVSNFIKNVTTGTCESKCGSKVAFNCGPGERAKNPVCTDMTPPRYSCEACPDRPGYKWGSWQSESPYECQYVACGEGTYSTSTGDLCDVCPKNTFSALNATECTPCEIGTKAEEGQASCQACFSGPPQDPIDGDITCEVGKIIVRDVAEMIDRLIQSTSYDKASILTFEFCDQDYACLECLPGSYQTDSSTCTLCPIGKYQPNYQQTSCYECSDGQSTGAVGSVHAEACLCVAGYE